MEGYTNVIGSQYDFDDLDIEGKVNDEWNTGAKVFYKHFVLYLTNSIVHIWCILGSNWL